MARWWNRAGSDAPVAPARPANPPPTAQRAAWQDLPPTSPAVTPIQPIAPLDPFVGSLATSYNPSFLGTLGHVVDPAGPSGHADGLIHVGNPATVSSGPDLAVAPRTTSSASRIVQRVAAGPRLLFGSPTDSSVPGNAQPPADSDHHEPLDPAAARPVATGTPAPPDTFALRTLPVTAAIQRQTAHGFTSAAGSTELPVMRMVAIDADTPAGSTDRPVAEVQPEPSSDGGSVAAVDAAVEPVQASSSGTAVGSPEPAAAPTLGASSPPLTVSRSADSAETGTELTEAARPASPTAARSELLVVDSGRSQTPTSTRPLGLGSPMVSVPGPAAPTGNVQRSAVNPLGSPAGSAGREAIPIGAPARPVTLPVRSEAGRPEVPAAESAPAVQLSAAPSTDPVGRLSHAEAASVPPANVTGSAASTDASSANVTRTAAEPAAPILGLSHLMRVIDQEATAEPAHEASTADAPLLKARASTGSPWSTPPRKLGLGAPIAAVPAVQRSTSGPSTASAAPRSSVASDAPRPLVPSSILRKIDAVDPASGPGRPDVESASVVPQDQETATSPESPDNSRDPVIAPLIGSAAELTSPEPVNQATLRYEPPSATPHLQRLIELPAAESGHHTGIPDQAPTQRATNPATIPAAPAPGNATPALTVAPTPVQRASTSSVGAVPAHGNDTTPVLPTAPLLALQRILTGSQPASVPATPSPTASQPSITSPWQPAAHTAIQRSVGTAGHLAPQTHSATTDLTFSAATMSAAPQPLTISTMSLQRMFEPGSAAVASGAARPDGSGSVVFNQPAPPDSAPIQRFFAPPNRGDQQPPEDTPDSAATVHRIQSDEPPAAPPPAPAPSTDVVQTAAAPAPAAAGAALPTDLDELARRLFDPLSARLKAELWLDRERAGLAIDLRR